jgi:hypothetical protein
MTKNMFLTAALLAAGLVAGLSGCISFDDPNATITYDTGSLRNVVRISDDGIDKGWLAVSKDGQKLLYCEQPVEFDPLAKIKNMSSRIMYLRNASVFAKTPLVESFAYGPAWYENGTNFIYILRNEDGTTQLIKSSVSGTSKTFVTRNPIGGGDNNPSVRDGIIACDSYINGARHIVTLRDNGSELTILGRGSRPSWHPTENKLVYDRDDSIWEMDTETTQETQLYAVSDKDRKDGIWAAKPVYLGDGKHIIFVKNVKVGYRYERHLFGMDTEGNNLTELAGGADIWAPACGAGNEIFFMSKAGGAKPEIWSALVTLE